MKTTKRILSLLLALALGAALLVPAFAADEVDPYAPIITKYDAPTHVTVRSSYILEVEAELPEGANGELSYAWYCASPSTAYNSGYGDPVAYGKTFKLTITKEMAKEEYVFVYVVVTNTYVDGNNETQTASIGGPMYRDSIKITSGLTWDYFLIIPLAILLVPVMLPLAIITLPLSFLGSILGPWSMMFLAPLIVPILPFLGAFEWLFDLFGIDLSALFA